MATIFLDDCLDTIENRFMLVVLAAHRARVIRTSKTALIPINGSKLTVVALREIAGKNIHQIELENDLVESLQTQIEVDVTEPTPSAPRAEFEAGDNQPSSESNRAEEIRFDLMSEDELIAGLEGIVEPERKEEYPEGDEESASPGCRTSRASSFP
jgi:DNA-directed RNA polymerase subunit omega